jgi:pimeloyl-ACP methyl ester carboxylesterase
VALVVALALTGCGGADPGEGTAAAGSAAAGSGPDPVAPDSIRFDDLSECKDPRVPPAFRCGAIDLPFERADPSLGKIRIAFAVRPAVHPNPQKQALIAIEGGPGYGSIGSARGYTDTFGRLLKSRDLILVDARGTGSSEPIDCSDLQRGRAPNAIGLSECAAKLGKRFDSYRTAAIADDINDVRAALGYGEVQVYGDSYGTYLAQSYAFRHRDTLTALVLDSAYPVKGESGWYPSVWRTGIRGLKTACDRSAECKGDAGARLDRFAAKLRRQGIDVGPFLDRLGSAGFAPPDSYLRIDRMVAAYLDGDDGPYYEMTKRGKAAYGPADHYSFGQELTVSCNDYPMIWDKGSAESRRRAELDEAIRGYRKDAFEPFTPREIALTSDVGYLECLGAPRPGRYYEPPAAADAPAPDAPVLVISGELDNVTSPAEGRAAAAEFPDSELFVWPNAGHVYALYDPASRGAVKIRRFLRQNG